MLIIHYNINTQLSRARSYLALMRGRKMVRATRGLDKISPYWLAGEKSIEDTFATRDFVTNGPSNWLSSNGMIAASKEVSVALVFHPAGLGSLKQLHRLRWPTISLPYPCRGVVSTMQHLAAVRANI